MANPNETRTEADAIRDIMRTSIETKLVELEGPDGNPVHVIARPTPNGVQVESIKKLVDEYRTNPERREGTAQLGDLASFIAHVKRFADDDSAIFALDDRKAPSLLAVLDYHQGGEDGEPRFGRHRSLYAFPVSDEWKAWTGANKTWMSMADFALFLEERLVDVTVPTSKPALDFASTFGASFATAARLLELSRGLSVRVNSRVQQAQNLSTGEGQILFHEEHQDEKGAPLKTPGAFAIGIPVFRSGAPYVIPARLRYRLEGGSVKWSYDLHRVDAVFDHAIREAATQAETETKLPLFFGKPE